MESVYQYETNEDVLLAKYMFHKEPVRLNQYVSLQTVVLLLLGDRKPRSERFVVLRQGEQRHLRSLALRSEFGQLRVCDSVRNSTYSLPRTAHEPRFHRLHRSTRCHSFLLSAPIGIYSLKTILSARRSAISSRSTRVSTSFSANAPQARSFISSSCTTLHSSLN